MLKRAHWLGAAAAAVIGAGAVTPLLMGGCQTTCAVASDCGSSSYCSTAVGVCLSAQAVGFCKDVPGPQDCPDVVEPVCGCDGKQYQNQCLAARARVSVSANGPCSTACGGPSVLTCTDTATYCHFADTNCGQGNATGTCDPVPASCAGATPQAVCGCDGKTYASRCDAEAAGTSVLALGDCPCGGISNTTCETGKYCQLAVGDCTMPNPSGTCVPIPTGDCTPFSSPVCGCDSKTYNNACEAAKAQKSVATNTACPCGVGGVTCAADEYCIFTMNGYCLMPGTMGTCAKRPTSCPTLISPVCGCDGMTYDNGCDAALNGTSIALITACPTDAGTDGG